MATLKNTVIDDTATLKMPVGTTAQRPSSPVDGDCRYNTDLGYMEFYYRGFWVDARTNTGGITGPNLELVLDVGNDASFSGSGTAWNDVSGNNRHFTWSGSRTRQFDTDHEHSSPGIPYIATNGNQWDQDLCDFSSPLYCFLCSFHAFGQCSREIHLQST